MHNDFKMESIINSVNLYYLNVNIIEAKQLSVTNVNTFVEVSVNKKSKIASSKTRNTNNPYFGKLLQFSLQETFDSLLKKKLRIVLFHSTCHKFIGLCEIELGTIWNQPGHYFFHKWAALSNPKAPFAGFTGYIKCDLELIEEGSHRVMPHSDLTEDGAVEKNLLMPYVANFRRKKGIFSIDVYAADGISYWKRRKYGKATQIVCKNLYVKVEFAGKTIQTGVVKNAETPSWNETLNFIDDIPSLFQTVQIELWDKQNNLLVGQSSLCLNDLWSPNAEDVLPNFGPAFLYLYKSTRKPHIKEMTGRVMIALSSELIDPHNPGKLIESFPIPPLPPCPYTHINVTLHFVIFQCTAFFKKYFDGFDVSLDHGVFVCPDDPYREFIDENGHVVHYLFSNEKEHVIRLENPKAINKHYSFWQFAAGNLPSASVSRQWCDRRDRDLCYNMIKYHIQRVLDEIKACNRLNDIGDQLQATERCKEVLKTLKNACQALLSWPPFDFQTSLDITRRVDYIENLENAMKELASIVIVDGMNCDAVQEFADRWVQGMADCAMDPQSRFPDFSISIMRNTDASPKSNQWLKAADYLYDKHIECGGRKCGKMDTFLFRDAAGDEIMAVEGLIWFGETAKFEEWKSYSNRSANGGFLELRVHVYQGRLNPGSDDSGLADPFVRVLAFGESLETSVKTETLDPVWDETLVFTPVPPFTNPQFIKEHSIGIIFEVLDYDGINNFELVGRGLFRPQVYLQNDTYVPPKLERVQVYSFGFETAEIVLTMELIEKPPDEESVVHKKQLFGIPQEIRPHFQNYRLEVLFWGLRDYQTNCFPPTPKVVVALECYKHKLTSSEAKAESTLNFDFQMQTCQLLLPVEKEYCPPLNASLFEIDFFNKLSYKGGAITPYISKFQRPSSTCCSSSSSVLDYTIKVESKSSNSSHIVELDEAPDWWTKYYATVLNNRDIKILKIYESELERQPEFHEFQDYLTNFHLTRGKSDLHERICKQKHVAFLKCAMQLHPTTDSTAPSTVAGVFRNEPLDITVRVYIIAAFDLPATDVNGQCDPYVVLVLGKTKVSDRQNFFFKDCNPIFGKCFELKGKFPFDHKLLVKVMDHDICLSDCLIGQTEIDLENRFYSRHRGSCGIADIYETSGYCKWRDSLQPFDILEQTCRQVNMPKPLYKDGHIIMGDCSVDGEGRGKEEIALEILKKFDKFSSGIQLVPEHVETRVLHYPGRPGVRRGRLEMWVDIFPGHAGLPPPVDVTPREPVNMELRVIVWNVADISAADINILTGENTSDLYVKAWITSPNETQKTDIHYNSLTGEGNFNWRFIFPFLYAPAEHKLIHLKKTAFSDGLWREKLPCILEMQVWDNDIVFDDFLGYLSLNLSNMPMGAKSARNCSLKMLRPDYPKCSLFKVKKCRGWWPFQKRNNSHDSGGKVEMELELFTRDEAKAMPAGRGRDGPQKLDDPKRPVTTLMSALNPLLFFKRIAFGNIGRKLIYAGVTIVIGMFFLSAWLALPGLLLKKWLSA